MLEPIENHLRPSELSDPGSPLVVRGWPLTVADLRANAEATVARYSFEGRPFIAISCELTLPDWDIDRILAGRRLRTRRSYVAAPASAVLAGGFGLLATFRAPHYSLVLRTYTDRELQQLLALLGEIRPNPHYLVRSNDDPNS